MATNSAQAIGYLDLNVKGFSDAIDFAKKGLLTLGTAFATVKTVDFWKNGIEGAIKFGNEAYFAAQKLNGYDPGKLFIVQKALQAGGLAAEEARGKIEEFGVAGRPLEQLFKGGRSSFADAMIRASKEYGTQAAVLSKSAESFASVQTQLNSLGSKLQGFFLGLADKIANPLSAILAQIDKVDLVGMGERFGKYVSEAIDAVFGLSKNNQLFEALALSLKVGIESSVNLLVGGIQTAFSIVGSSSFWKGVGQLAVGGLAQIGTFLTNLFLGIGKLFVAVVEAGLAKLRPILSRIPGIGSKVKESLSSFSPDISENYKRNEKNSNILGVEKAQELIGSKATEVQNSGLRNIASAMVEVSKNFKTGQVFDTTKDGQKLSSLISKAIKSGSELAPSTDKKNPLFSETADPIHVIADSLARVGGGGRYVRTGLSIAEKAALDSLRFQKQIADNTLIIAASAKKTNHGISLGFVKGG